MENGDENNEFSTYLNFKLSKMENWSSNSLLELTYNSQKVDEVKSVLSYKIDKVEQFGFSLFPEKNIYFQPFVKYSENVSSAGFGIGAGLKFFNSIFFNANYKNSISLNNENNLIVEQFVDVDDVSDIYLDGLDDALMPSKSLHKFSASLSKTFQTPIYFESFPMGLRRISPFFTYNNVLEDKGAELKFIDENIYGLNFELLFLRKIPIPLVLKLIDNSISGVSAKFEMEMRF
jgi:hypothetical protein